LSTSFTQFGDQFNGNGTFKLAGGAMTSTTVVNQTFTANRMVSNHVETNLATFQLRADVVEELKAKYVERPLTFPVNFFIINRFAGQPPLNQPLNHILSTTVNNCDTLFLLVPNTPNSQTCFYNPYIKGFQLDAGPYGTYPSQPMDTYSSHRFINMIADSLNVNNSVLTSFNKDVTTSFCDSAPYTVIVTDKSDGTGAITPTDEWRVQGNVGDTSNFFIGIPFSVDDDYQGGMSSPSSSIVFKVTGSGVARSDNQCPRHIPDMGAGWNTNWYACFLIDGSLMIKPDITGEAARVIYSDRSIV
jgi:hypothetical protein